jgi:ABC-2 type transport system permease protein
MKRWLINVWLLGAKELRSVMKDTTLLVLIVFAFTAAVLIVSKGVKAEVSNATVALIDDDHSELSRRLADAIRPPYFQTPVAISRADVAGSMDQGRTIFVIEIPRVFRQMSWPGAVRRCRSSSMPRQ